MPESNRSNFRVSAATREAANRQAHRLHIPVGTLLDGVVLAIVAAPPQHVVATPIEYPVLMNLHIPVYGLARQMLHELGAPLMALDGLIAQVLSAAAVAPGRMILHRWCAECAVVKPLSEFPLRRSGRYSMACGACCAAVATKPTPTIAAPALIDTCSICGTLYASHPRCRICGICLGPGHAYAASASDPQLDVDCARRHARVATRRSQPAAAGQAVAR